MTEHTHTLSRNDYLGDDVYAAEQERIFHRGWFLAGAGARLQPGNRTPVNVAGDDTWTAIVIVPGVVPLIAL